MKRTSSLVSENSHIVLGASGIGSDKGCDSPYMAMRMRIAMKLLIKMEKCVQTA